MQGVPFTGIVWKINTVSDGCAFSLGNVIEICKSDIITFCSVIEHEISIMSSDP